MGLAAAPIRRIAIAALVLAAEIVAGLAISASAPSPAAAQFWGEPYPYYQPRRRIQPLFNPFGIFRSRPPVYEDRERERPRPRRGGVERRAPAPVDFSRAPAPRKPEGTPTTSVVVVGDAMADWLGYGLEEAFAENSEFGVVRKHRTVSGLIRNASRESYDWTQASREIVTAEKPQFVVMMIGLTDRQPIRERTPVRMPQNIQPTATGQTPEAPAATTTTTHEFHSERWVELYTKRIDDTIAAMKARGSTVIWVGLPVIRGQKSKAELTFLNDLYRGRAEKAGITYVDVWDGFADEDGNFALRGPDYNGQMRQLRTGDGIYFTKAGAAKLGHYVEREIRRLMIASTTPVALPVPEQQPAPEVKSGGPTPRPVAGPVVPLNAVTSGSELAGAPTGASAAADPLVSQVMVRGEPLAPPSGRADDFAWSGREPPSASGVILPPSGPPAAPAATRPARKAAPTPSQQRPTPKQRPQASTTPPSPRQVQ
jgi:hypothetical protein